MSDDEEMGLSEMQIYSNISDKVFYFDNDEFTELYDAYMYGHPGFIRELHDLAGVDYKLPDRITDSLKELLENEYVSRFIEPLLDYMPKVNHELVRQQLDWERFEEDMKNLPDGEFQQLFEEFARKHGVLVDDLCAVSHMAETQDDDELEETLSVMVDSEFARQYCSS